MFSAGVIADNRSTSFKLVVGTHQDKQLQPNFGYRDFDGDGNGATGSGFGDHGQLYPHIVSHKGIEFRVLEFGFSPLFYGFLGGIKLTIEPTTNYQSETITSDFISRISMDNGEYGAQELSATGDSVLFNYDNNFGANPYRATWSFRTHTATVTTAGDPDYLTQGGIRTTFLELHQ